MTLRVRSLGVACGVVLLVLPCLSGCTATAARNRRDAVLVVTGPERTRADVQFVLELKQTRVEVPLRDLDAFLAGERATALSRAVKATIARKRRNLEQTLAKARESPANDVILFRPESERPYANDNIVAYVKGKAGYHVYDTGTELEQLLAFKSMAPDLQTLQYTHALFEPAVLTRLKTETEAAGLDLENAKPARAETRQLRLRAATGVLERALRDMAVTLDTALPLLTSSPFERSRSPKLTAALRHKSTLERVVRCGDPDVIRALVYLADQDVIDLAQP